MARKNPLPLGFVNEEGKEVGKEGSGGYLAPSRDLRTRFQAGCDWRFDRPHQLWRGWDQKEVSSEINGVNG